MRRTDSAKQAAQYTSMPDAAWSWLFAHMSDEIQLVAGAPVLFVFSLLIISAATWFVGRGVFGVRIANLQSAIGLRDAQIADYKDKLSGKTPDEAKAQIDALSARVAALEPRILTPDQIKTIAQHVAVQGVRPLLRINYEASVPDAKLYGEGFIAAFQNAGWATEATVIEARGAPPSGLGLRVKSRDDLSDYERLAIAAFRGAEVPFEIIGGTLAQGQVSILIGTRRTR